MLEAAHCPDHSSAVVETPPLLFQTRRGRSLLHHSGATTPLFYRLGMLFPCASSQLITFVGPSSDCLLLTFAYIHRPFTFKGTAEAGVPFATSRPLHSLRAMCVPLTARLPREDKHTLPRPMSRRNSHGVSNVSAPCRRTTVTSTYMTANSTGKTASTAGKKLPVASAPDTPQRTIQRPATPIGRARSQ